MARPRSAVGLWSKSAHREALGSRADFVHQARSRALQSAGRLWSCYFKYECYLGGEIKISIHNTHVQGKLFKDRRGGKRKGAGRPKSGFRASERHKRRDEVRANWPVHVTIRVGRDVPYLRKRNIWRAIAKATLAATKTGAARVVHASLQHNHLHLLVEAKDQYALAKGMHAFQVSAAHWINLAAARTGRVFPDRYHTHVLKTPREVRNALQYVLCNWRKHGEDRNSRSAIDWYSTGSTFWGVPREEPLPVSAPASWLLRVGWQRAGTVSPR